MEPALDAAVRSVALEGVDPVMAANAALDRLHQGE
jgi:hypothetical protein